LLLAENIAIFDPSRPTRLETDASGFALGACLLQQVNNEWKPCGYYLKKLLPAEYSYPIHDKELLAIIKALKFWKPELKSTAFTILCNHKNLEYFTTTKKLSERQIRWSEIISEYDFNIFYIPGVTNKIADALFRKDQNLPDGENDPLTLSQFGQLFENDFNGKITLKVRKIKETFNGNQFESPFELQELNDLWNKVIITDTDYVRLINTVKDKKYQWLTDLKRNYNV
jgi:hypothetical protein